jgi:hypothetical protein
MHSNDVWYGRNVRWFESKQKTGMIVANSRMQNCVIVEWDNTFYVDVININDLVALPE